METGSRKFNTQANAAVRAGMAMNIATCIIVSGISRWCGFTDILEFFTRNPDSEPLVTTCSQLAVRAVAENLVYGIASEFETDLPTLTTSFSHLFSPALMSH